MTAMVLKIKSTRTWQVLSIPLLILVWGGIFYMVAVRIVSPIDYANSDFFTFWLSGHLALLGKDPYVADIWLAGHQQFGASWVPNPTLTYPLPISLLFAPLGWMPVYQAFVLWVVVTEFMIAISIGLLLKPFLVSLYKHFILPLLAGIVLFRPTIIALHNGTVSGPLLLTAASIAYLWEKGKWRQGSILLPIFALKPNLGVPIILYLSLYLILRRQIRALILGAAAGLALLCIGWLQDPNWIIGFWRAGNTYLSQIFGYTPTIWGVSAYLCNYSRSCAIGFGAVAALIVLIVSLWLMVRMQKELSPTWAVGLAVTATLLLTPTAWPYDQLLLIIPIISIVMALARAGFAFLPTALIFLGIDIMAFLLLGITARIEVETWNAAIPLLILGILGWMIWKGTSRENREPVIAH